jgi:tetratricopeptide (TPR) repeat protein
VRLTARRALSLSAAALAIVVSSVPASAQAPAAPGPRQPEYKNLKVLPPDTTRPQLTAIMHGFTDSLGVRCDFCHAGANGKMDFASDEKDEKKSARAMMKMTWAINKDSLPTLEGMSKDAEVTCYTCHRGSKHPTRQLAAVLTDTAAAKGSDAAIAQFKDLREKNAESGLYDFRAQQLAMTAERLGWQQKNDEALALLKAAVALFPNSADAAASYAGALAQSGDKAGAEAEFNRALSLDPNNFGAKMGLDRLKNPPPPRQ